MSTYKLEITDQSWRHLTPAQLAQTVQNLSNMGLHFDVKREEEPKPAPEVRTVTEYVRVYQCPECAYNSQSQNSVNSHRRVHSK